MHTSGAVRSLLELGPEAQRALRANPIPLPPPFDDHLRFPERVEWFPVQPLVTHRLSEALDVAVLPLASRHSRPNTHMAEPEASMGYFRFSSSCAQRS